MALTPRVTGVTLTAWAGRATVTHRGVAMEPIACSRMYNVTARAKRAWHDLFAWVGRHSGITLDIIEHAAPAPLGALWAREDMGCVFMCGWPFAQAGPQPRPIAAPLPAAPRYGGRAVYFTDFVVRADRGFETLEDTFGGRIGWTVEHSHSGFNAPRHHLLAFRTAARPTLYRESVGPLTTPAGALAAVIDSRVDIAPLDSFALELIARHEPERVADIAVLASTAATPIPPLVAAPDLDPAICDALRRAFLDVGTDPALQSERQALGLSGFAVPVPDDYRLTTTRSREALEAGYDRPA